MIDKYLNTISEINSNISWETVIAIVGALAWVPWIYEKLTPAKLYGSLISNLSNQGTFNTKFGTLHFLKLSISCINKNFNVVDCSIKIKYFNNEKKYDGSIFWARTSRWSMDPQGRVTKNLVIPNEEFLGFVNMLEKDKSVFYYLTFIVEKNTLEEFEEINIKLKNPQGKEKYIKFKSSELNPDKILFDDKIWQ